MLQVAGVMLLVFSVMPYLSNYLWQLDLLTHFRFQYLVLSLLLFIGFIVLKIKKYALISLICVVINSAYVVPLYTKKTNTIAGLDQSNIKLFHANVLSSNKSYNKLVNEINKENPDVIILQEVNQHWIAAMAVIKTQYQYFIEEPREDNFGMALFSKIPIKNHQIHHWSDFEIPGIEAEFDSVHRSFRLIATHPPPPINKYYYDAGTTIFKTIAKEVQSKEIATIIIGDLNTTTWSEKYQILETDTQLLNASTGFGPIPTWPTTLIPLMIPIDHCLVSRHFNVKSTRTGESIGSDHLPLIIELNL